MAEMDFIQPKQVISKTLVYNQKDLYKFLMKWFAARHYAVVELAYKEKELSPGTKEYSFDWANEKKIEDFTKLFIEVGFKAVATDVVIETIDGKRKAQKGDVEVEFKAYVSKDVEGDYKLSGEAPQRRLLREFYEQFIIKRKMARFEDQLKKDLKAILADLKTYLKAHRYD
tara:strand:+ start:10876 stop:11388 length:513 start_codon:yes stop_codon:yes gene_type:complete